MTAEESIDSKIFFENLLLPKEVSPTFFQKSQQNRLMKKYNLSEKEFIELTTISITSPAAKPQLDKLTQKYNKSLQDINLIKEKIKETGFLSHLNLENIFAAEKDGLFATEIASIFFWEALATNQLLTKNIAGLSFEHATCLFEYPGMSKILLHHIQTAHNLFNLFHNIADCIIKNDIKVMSNIGAGNWPTTMAEYAEKFSAFTTAYINALNKQGQDPKSSLAYHKTAIIEIRDKFEKITPGIFTKKLQSLMDLIIEKQSPSLDKSEKPKM